MKWFRHNSDSYTNLKMQELFEEFGIVGYGIFWLACELVAQQGTDYQIDNNKNWKKAISNISKTPLDTIEKVLERCADITLIDKEALSKNRLFIPKMEEYSDDYTNRLRRLSEQPTNNVRQHNITIHNNTRDNITKDKNIYSSNFEEFWKEYPNKTGKLYASRCFNKINPSKTLLATMLEAINKQKESDKWKDENGRYIPNPSTWLNQGRWEDEVIIKPKRQILRL